MPFIKWILLLFVMMCSLNSPVFAQNYGLGFFSQETLKDHRTELILSTNKEFKFDRGFTLSFNLKLRPSLDSQYGYVLRVIQNDSANVDIVYNVNLNDATWNFHLISGQHTTEMPFSINRQAVFQDWVTFHLEFNPNIGTVTLTASDSIATSISMAFQEKDTYRIHFGACNYGKFKTRDVPSINLKEIKIHDEKKLRHHWPMNEEFGDEAKDIVGGKTASIRNPDWLKPKHEDWLEIMNTKLRGAGQVAVNLSDEIVYLIGAEQMIAYSISDNSYEIIAYPDSLDLLPGGQAFYNPTDNSICSYVVNDQSWSSFNLSTRKWNIKSPQNKEETVYLHHNKYFSPTDSSLYIFGGYGQYEYKNSVQKCNLGKQQWEFLKPGGDFFEPRYLAASGNLGDTVYILGGYGSPGGKQMLSPQHYNHMMAYSLSTQQFVRKFDVNMPLQDLCFSNSMVLLDEPRTYYALAFPLFTDEGYLQLVKGSLDTPNIELMGERLPYFFHDTKSYSDLFYFPVSNKLIAYTSFIEDEQITAIQLYSMLYPPNQTSEFQRHQEAGSYSNTLLILIIIALGLGFVFFIVVFFKRKKDVKSAIQSESTADVSRAESNPIESAEIPPKRTVLFFGGFQVYDKDGIEITGHFTPLLKELFLLIWLHTLKNNKGISSELMTETLWFDKSPRSARNNKSVNIAKLRAILNEVGSCELTHKTGYWKINCDDKEVYNDYHEFLKITESKTSLSRQNILQLLKIAGKGALLHNLNYEWLDKFKASISETTIEILFSFAQKLDIARDASLVIQIADCIFTCDSINEEAMALKCKAHYEMGAHSLSKSTYTKFGKEYNELYNQQYDTSFADIVSKSLTEILNYTSNRR